MLTTTLRVCILACLIGTLGALPTAHALPPDLLAWWSGDVDAQDASGHGAHGTLMAGAQAGLPGFQGGAFMFDGVAAYLSTPLPLPPQGTIDLWVFPTDLTQGIYGLLGTLGVANGEDRLWLTARGALGGLGIAAHQLVVNTGSCCVSEVVVPSPLVAGTWTHLALTFDYTQDVYALYTHGALVAVSTAPRTPPTHPLDVGATHSDFRQHFFWQGLLDEVHLFGRVLTPEEIATLATPTPRAGFVSPIVSHGPPHPATAGQTIPILFRFDDAPSPTLFAPGSPTSQPIQCATGASLGSPEATRTPGKQGVHYDATTAQYTYPWKSDKTWRGTCRLLQLGLADGSVHVAPFVFK